MKTLLFIQQYPFTSLGLMYISAVLKQHGHRCIVLIEKFEKNMLTTIKESNPDLIGFQVFTGQHQWAIRTASILKQHFTTPILFGGSHPTHNPDILKYVDFICRGEGEYATLELLEDKRGIANINTNPIRPLVDIDTLPFPDRGLYHRYRIFRTDSIRRFITSRGCPYTCTFCHNHLDMALYKGKGQWARKRKPALVIKEIQEVRKVYPFRIVDFSPDDYFLSDREWAIDFLKRYCLEIKMPFCFNTRPESVDEEMAALLKLAGCRGGAVSVETEDDFLRNKVLNKQTRYADIVNAVKCLKKVGIAVKTYNMIGIPGETIGQALRTLRLNMKMQPTWARCAIISPYPNTNIWNIGLAKGVLNPLSIDDFSDTYTDETLFKIKDKNQMVNLQRFFAVCVRFPFLYPAVRWLIKFPRNWFFDTLGRFFFGYYAVKYWGYSFRDLVKYSYHYMRTGQPV